MDIYFVVYQMISGLSYSMLLFLMASGLTIIFGLLNIPNFGHGSLYMLGAYCTVFFLNQLHFPFFLSVLLSVLCLAVVGAILEIIPMRKIYERPHALQLLMTFTFILILDGTAKYIWGTSFHNISTPEYLSGSINILGGRQLPIYSIFIIICGLVVGLLLWLTLYRTKVGKMVRAGISNKEMLSALGINVPMLFTIVFMVGAALAGLAGGLAGPLSAVTTGMGETIIITIFAIIIVGGVGSLKGAFISSLIIGELNTFGIILFPQFAMLFTYVLIIIILLTKPEGLFTT